jgi:hypothetical protein
MRTAIAMRGWRTARQRSLAPSADRAVDVLIVALAGPLPGITEAFAADICEFLPMAPKPLVVTWNSWTIDVPSFKSSARVVSWGPTGRRPAQVAE